MCTCGKYILKEEGFQMFILFIYCEKLCTKSILFEAVCRNCGHGKTNFYAVFAILQKHSTTVKQ